MVAFGGRWRSGRRREVLDFLASIRAEEATVEAAVGSDLKKRRRRVEVGGGTGGNRLWRRRFGGEGRERFSPLNGGVFFFLFLKFMKGKF